MSDIYSLAGDVSNISLYAQMIFYAVAAIGVVFIVFIFFILNSLYNIQYQLELARKK